MKTEALRPFIPAANLEASIGFYAALGFEVTSLGPDLALLRQGLLTALLQHYDAKDFAANYMIQWVVDDLAAAWKQIEALDLVQTHAVQPPRPPATQPWGKTVAYLFDPSGVLLHLTEN